MLSSFRRLAGIRTLALGSLVATAGLFTGAIALRAAPPGPAPYLGSFPDFAPGVTPQLPGDVDIALKKSLEAKQQFPLVQREFDLYSWQMFLSLSWPTDASGKPAPKLTDTGFGSPRWTLWHTSPSIFQVDGATPAACAKPGPAMLATTRELSKPVSRGLKAFSSDAVASAGGDARGTRFLGVISAVGEVNAANLGSDIQQAFTGPLIDQNKEFVFYEIMIDPNETKYLCDNGLYNINGQVKFAKTNPKVNMPSGVSTADDSGSFELKFAWRILKKGKDDFSRFFTMNAVVMDQGPDGKPVERKVVVGLVGMHIGHKTASSPQWIWSTFEQIDNLDVDPVAHPNLSPSFVDPNCPICAVNIQPVADQKTKAYPRIPTQAWRAIPIPGDKIALNQQAQAALRAMGSVWQYYQLIDTQWPTDPASPPPGWNSGLPGAVANKSGGNPTPVMLTNITMETYFQGGNQAACNNEELPSSIKNCPVASIPTTPPVWNSILNNSKNPVKPGVNTTTFITESCTGCHSSAGLYTSYTSPKINTKSGQLTGDFSWLLTQKANWNPKK